MGDKTVRIPGSVILVGAVIVGLLFVNALFPVQFQAIWKRASDQTKGLITGSGVNINDQAPSSGVYTGNINFIESQQDMLAGAAASPTSPTYRLFLNRPSTSASGGIALTATGTVREAPAQGYVYLACYGGTDFMIMDPQRIPTWSTTNPRVTEYYWADLDANNSPELVLKIRTADIGVNGQSQTPTLTTTIPLIKVDTVLADDSPADVSSIGTSSTTTTVVWKLSGCTANYGGRLGRLYLTLNCTSASGLVVPEVMTLSGGWTSQGGMQTYWSNPIQTVEGSTSYYYYVNGAPDTYEYQNGIPFEYGPGSSDSLYVSVTFRCNLGAGNKEVATLYYDTVSSAGAIATLNDAVTLAA